MRATITSVDPLGADGLCVIKGCDRESDKNGFCAVHYQRWNRTGSPISRTRRLRRHGKTWNHAAGYVVMTVNGSQKLEHVVIAERALGRPLPPGAEVHHVNEIKSDNRNSNLVICPNRSYHLLLHVRTAAYDACGNADYRRCRFCKRWDAPQNLLARRSGHGIANYHRDCYNTDRRTKYALRAA